MTKFKINPIVEDSDEETVDISSELSGRIIFCKGDNFGEPLWWYDEGKDATTKDRLGIDFYCSPETKEGYLEDNNDCGLYKQLEELFESCEKEGSIGAAENYHQLLVPLGWTVEQTWRWLKESLIEAGAVEKDF
jgi:hypothetical protein